MTHPFKCDVASLVLRHECQVRVAKSDQTIAEYAALIIDGAELPPIEVADVGGELWVTDGFHRADAHALAQKKDPRHGFCRVVVTQTCDPDQATLAAIRANHAHGLPRTQADKRRAVRMALDCGALDGASNRTLADEAGVSEYLVRTVRAEWEAERQPSPGKDATDVSCVHIAPKTPKVTDEGPVTSRKKPSARVAKAKAPEPPPRNPWEAAVVVVGNLSGLLSRTRREVREHAEHETQAVRELVRGLDDGLSAMIAACAAAAPVECPKHAEGCKLCGGAGWVTTRQAEIATRSGK